MQPRAHPYRDTTVIDSRAPRTNQAVIGAVAVLAVATGWWWLLALLALPGQSVTIRLEDDVDVSRGDMLADPASAPVAARELVANVCWMTEKPIEERARVFVKQTTRTVPARVDEIVSVIDIQTLEDSPSPGRMELNDLGVVRFRLAEPLAVDPYARNRATGAFILIDEATNDTVGAGMVIDGA